MPCWSAMAQKNGRTMKKILHSFRENSHIALLKIHILHRRVWSLCLPTKYHRRQIAACSRISRRKAFELFLKTIMRTVLKIVRPLSCIFTSLNRKRQSWEWKLHSAIRAIHLWSCGNWLARRHSVVVSLFEDLYWNELLPQSLNPYLLDNARLIK